jgi:hypothetical protein
MGEVHTLGDLRELLLQLGDRVLARRPVGRGPLAGQALALRGHRGRPAALRVRRERGAAARLQALLRRERARVLVLERQLARELLVQLRLRLPRPSAV